MASFITCFEILIILSIYQQQVESRGFFEVKFVDYKIKSNLSLCCPSRPIVKGHCGNYCRIYVKLCLSVSKEYAYKCVVGDGEIKSNILDSTSKTKRNSKYSLLVREKWQPQFSIVADILHRNEAGANISIITLTKMIKDLQPGKEWVDYDMTKDRKNIKLQILFRFVCDNNYYGKDCEKLCEPSAGPGGHYNCSSEGQKICKKGYSGKYCDKVVCSNKCVHGTCMNPNICQCFSGWKGKSCDKCETHPNCINGSCRIDKATNRSLPLTCECNPGWGGMFCNINLDFCKENPKICQNDGHCKNTGNSTTNQEYRCECAPGYKGTHCEIPMMDCKLRKCLNGGECVNHTCVCKGVYHGGRCEFNQTSCVGKPCLGHGSTCQDKNNGYQCTCEKGLYGNNCEHNEDDCRYQPCKNGGRCIDLVNGYRCSCLVGFSGKNCNVNKNDCQRASCANNGQCIDSNNKIRCRCASGWRGLTCLEDVDECTEAQGRNSTLCQNGGVCHNTLGSYKCVCPRLWTGAHCGVSKSNSCSHDKPCQNNGVCVVSRTNSTPPVCRCPSNYGGPNCELIHMDQYTFRVFIVVIIFISIIAIILLVFCMYYKTYKISQRHILYQSDQPINHQIDSSSPYKGKKCLSSLSSIPFCCCFKRNPSIRTKSNVQIKVVNNKLALINNDHTNPLNNKDHQHKSKLTLTKLNNQLSTSSDLILQYYNNNSKSKCYPPKDTNLYKIGRDDHLPSYRCMELTTNFTSNPEKFPLTNSHNLLQQEGVSSTSLAQQAEPESLMLYPVTKHSDQSIQSNLNDNFTATKLPVLSSTSSLYNKKIRYKPSITTSSTSSLTSSIKCSTKCPQPSVTPGNNATATRSSSHSSLFDDKNLKSNLRPAISQQQFYHCYQNPQLISPSSSPPLCPATPIVSSPGDQIRNLKYTPTQSTVTSSCPPTHINSSTSSSSSPPTSSSLNLSRGALVISSRYGNNPNYNMIWSNQSSPPSQLPQHFHHFHHHHHHHTHHHKISSPITEISLTDSNPQPIDYNLVSNPNFTEISIPFFSITANTFGTSATSPDQSNTALLCPSQSIQSIQTNTTTIDIAEPSTNVDN